MHTTGRFILLALLIATANGPLPVDADIEDIIGSFINVALGQRPNNENGTNSQNKERALNDRSNFDIYNSTAQEIIERSGYRQRTFEVMSDDGYITQLINIVNHLVERENLRQPPVMLFHGGLIDSTVWIWANAIQHHPEKYPRDLAKDGPITSSNRSLAFVLANNGYDVWLVGTRGSNKQNLGHARYKAKLLDELLEDFITGEDVPASSAQSFVDTIKYFDYSMDELADYEYPKQIEAVLQLTGSDKVSIVGLSFGTPIMFRILSSNKSLARRVHSYVALLPLLNTNGSSSLIKALVELAPRIPTPLGTVLFGLIFSKPVRDFLRKLKRYETYKMLLTLLLGSSAKYTTFLEEPVVGHLFVSTGFKEIQHFAQQIKEAKLQRFDYGPLKNLHIYGSAEPTGFNLSKFKLKRWMIATGANDILGPPSSGDQYASMITNSKPDKHLNIPGYNHVDMVGAFDNDIKINLPVLEFLNKFHTNFSEVQQEPQ